MTDEEADLEIEIARARAKAQKASPAAPAPAVAAPSEPAALAPESQSGTALRSFGRGASFGFTPALAGVSGALQELGSRGPLGRMASLAAPAALGPLAGPAMLASAGSAPEVAAGSDEQLGEFRDLGTVEAMIQRFRADRDRARNDQERGARANPKTAMAAEVAGAMAMPGPKGGTLGGRMAGYTGQGALMGAGTASSKPDGDAADVGMGALAGFVGGGMGEGVSAAGRSIIRKGAGVVGDIVQGRAAKDAADVAKEVGSLKGAFGAEVQKGSRQLENVQRGVSGVPSSTTPSGISPQTQSQAIQALNSPEAAALQTSVLENTMDALPNQAGAIERAKAAFQTASAAAPREAPKRTQDYFNDSLWKTEISPRLVRTAQRGGVAVAAGTASGLLGAGVGAVTGQDPIKTAALGATTGFGSVLGAQGLLTMARGLANSPRAQRMAVEGTIRGVEQGSELATRMGTGGAALLDAKSAQNPELKTLGQFLSSGGVGLGGQPKLGDVGPQLRQLRPNHQQLNHDGDRDGEREVEHARNATTSSPEPQLGGRSVADPMGPLRQYLGLSAEERKEADADAFTKGGAP